MKSYSFAEENYLKSIHSLSFGQPEGVSTNSIARLLNTKASSVTAMIGKLHTKELVSYEKYKGVTLTPEGEKIAIGVLRKHRLWEVFLVDKLDFKWDEVHEVAEQLEHIRSVQLTDRLDKFLGEPKFDPHGDPIPSSDGVYRENQPTCLLSDLNVGDQGVVVGVLDSSKEFLRFLSDKDLLLGTQFSVVKLFEYDESREIKFDDRTESLSQRVSTNIKIKRL